MNFSGGNNLKTFIVFSSIVIIIVISIFFSLYTGVALIIFVILMWSLNKRPREIFKQKYPEKILEE
jgi:hypothetical protein